jgi:hypothetical protein
VATIENGRTVVHKVSGERLNCPARVFITPGGLHVGAKEPSNAIAHVYWKDYRLLVRPINAELIHDDKDIRLKE